MKTVLTIAGSDSSGGAGIQADLKTMISHGVYGMSAITALTAQNTLGVTDVLESTPEFLAAQLDAVFTDIYPDAVKIGMVSSAPLIKVIADKLNEYDVPLVVVDPVMVATSGSALMESDATETLKQELLPIATVLTPNIAEAEALSGLIIKTHDDMVTAAKHIGDTYHCAVLCKGGHRQTDANDVLYHEGVVHWFESERVDNPNAHGTGCTLASAIASNLAKDFDLITSIERAKAYLTDALRAGLDLGKGSGPLDHGFDIHSKYSEMNNHDRI